MEQLLNEATNLLFEHSLFNGHPRLLGYITSSPAPIGALGDFLAAAVNQNMGAWEALADGHRDRSAECPMDWRGLGTDSIRWIAADGQQRMRLPDLRARIEQDLREGGHTFLVVGTAGSVSTGAIDPLPEMGAICREFDLWFHVDGAYGALAAQVPGAPASLRGLSDADSVAVDPHKWLYAPLEAGCALVRRAEGLSLQPARPTRSSPPC